MRQGVYIVKGSSGRPIYIGSSVDVDRRLRQHQKKAWWPEARSVEVIEIQSWPEALRAERSLIRTINPRHNTRSLHNSVRILRQIVTASSLDEVVALSPRRRKAVRDLTAIDLFDLAADAPKESDAHRLLSPDAVHSVATHGTIGAAVHAGAFKNLEVAA